jgi:hypothetical protein
MDSIHHARTILTLIAFWKLEFPSSPMTRCNRFLAILPDPNCPLDQFATHIGRASSLRLENLRDKHYFLAADVQSPASTARSIVSDQPVTVVRAYAGVPDFSRFGIEASLSQDVLYSRLEEHVQLFHLIHALPQSLSIDSDCLGLIPYYYRRIRDGYVVASHLHDLFTVLPEARKPLSPLGLLEAFVYDCPLGNRTLHEEVYRPYAGQSVQWTLKDGWAFHHDKKLQIPEADVSLDAASAIDELLCLYREATKSRLDFFEGTPLLPLTGGFDSRLLACVLSGLTSNVETLTMGLRWHDDYQIAKRIAGELSFPHRLIPPTRTYEQDIEDSIQHSEGQVGWAGAYLANLPIRSSDKHRLLFHGFLCDAISGAHMSWVKGKDGMTFDGVADGIAVMLTKNLSPDFPALMGISCSYDDIRHQVWQELDRSGLPYQALVIWNLENRQRLRGVRQLAHVGDTFYIYCPTYNRAIMQRWLSLPRCLLEGRTLLRQLFATRYRRISLLHKAEEDHLILPRTWNSLTFTARIAQRKLLNRLRSSLRLRNAHEKYRSWTMWHGTTPQRLAFEKRRLEESQAVIEETLGYRVPVFEETLLRRFSDYRPRAEMVVRRAMMVGEYAKYIAD